MLAYIIRRLAYAVPILIGVNVATFLLFFAVNSPDQMARSQLGPKGSNPVAVEKWKEARNYHLPMVFNAKEETLKGKVQQTIFWQKVAPLFLFDFGRSDREKDDIGRQIRKRMIPSLVIAIPTFLIGLLVYITFALILAFYRGTYLDFWGVVICIVLMSVSILFYIIGGQYLFGIVLRIFPISGYTPGVMSAKFAIMPVVVGVITGVGGSSRFYRTIFLEEINRDYVRTARAKGLSERRVLYGHVLRNALIPILTNLVIAILFLFMGSLLLERFFAIPGLGSYLIDGIQGQDNAVVRSIVYLGAVLFVVGLILTDLCYTLVDPRVRLE